MKVPIGQLVVCRSGLWDVKVVMYSYSVLVSEEKGCDYNNLSS